MPSALETLLGYFATIITSFVGWVGDFADVIVANPIILVPFAIPIIGAGVGFLLRLARPN